MVLIRDVGIHPVLNLSADNKCRWDENSTKANVFLLQYLLLISYFTRILNFAIPLFGIKSREYKIAISNFFFVISNASKLSEKLERDLKIHQGCFSRDYAENNSSPFIFWIYSNRFASLTSTGRFDSPTSQLDPYQPESHWQVYSVEEVRSQTPLTQVLPEHTSKKITWFLGDMMVNS